MVSKRVRYTTVAKQLDGQPGTSSSTAGRLSKELECLRHDRNVLVLHVVVRVVIYT